MARDFDNFPVYDALVKQGTFNLSSIWSDFFATFIESLQGYLSQYGVFVPMVTTEQRDSLQNPQTGQMIYNTDTNTVEVYGNNWGFCVPRVTTASRNALPNVINGQLIYNTTLNKFQGYENGAWTNLI